MLALSAGSTTWLANLIVASWGIEGVQASDAKRIDTIKKVFTQVTMHKPENAWMKRHPSTVYQSAFIDIKDAFSRWRKGQNGFPKKKSKKKGDSFTVYKTSGIYPEKGQPALLFTNRVVIHAGKRITLPGLRTFRLKERIDFTCSSQSFTVSRTASRWFVAFVLDVEKLPPIIHRIEKIGVDLGVKTLATCSDGSRYEMPITTKRAKTRAWAREFTSRAGRRDPQGKLGKIQWRNRKKTLGNKRAKIKASNNARKFYDKVACQHVHIANIRRDTTQKMTTDLSRKAYTIRIEELNVSGMIANHKLASAVSDNCFYEIRRQLTYKQSHYGTKVELVDRWYPSSKMCSRCHHVQPMSLSDRVFFCENKECGLVDDRDFNAAKNLENAPDHKVRLA